MSMGESAVLWIVFGGVPAARSVKPDILRGHRRPVDAVVRGHKVASAGFELVERLGAPPGSPAAGGELTSSPGVCEVRLSSCGGTSC